MRSLLRLCLACLTLGVLSARADPQLDAIVDTDLAVGDSVEVLPIDYGFQATRGELVVASPSAIVIKRHDERAGELLVHFPRLGFQVRRQE